MVVSHNNAERCATCQGLRRSPKLKIGIPVELSFYIWSNLVDCADPARLVQGHGRAKAVSYPYAVFKLHISLGLANGYCGVREIISILHRVNCSSVGVVSELQVTLGHGRVETTLRSRITASRTRYLVLRTITLIHSPGDSRGHPLVILRVSVCAAN